mgnify:CR=1 FL=1
MSMIEFVTTNPIKTITTIGLVIGLFLKIGGYKIAKKKSDIDIKNFNDKNKIFTIYLVDFYRIINILEEKKFLIFHIKLTNKANSKNTYNAELDLNYHTKDNINNIVKLKHQAELFSEIKHKDLTKLDTNIRLNEKEMTSGWLIFKLPKHLHKNRIKKYSVSIYDTEKNTLKIDSYIVKDIIYEN